MSGTELSETTLAKSATNRPASASSRPEDARLTPMLAQYFEWKDRYPDCILFFRMGDFYEMFFDDAVKASAILDITLTARDAEKSVPMAGVPWHSVNGYLARLVRAKFKVAICEQVTEPGGRGLVERRVVRVVTPGTFVPEEAGSGGRLAAICRSGEDLAVALLSVETGRLEAGVLSRAEAGAILGSFAPGELIHPAGLNPSEWAPQATDYFAVPREDEFFNPALGTRRLLQLWGATTLASFGLEDDSPAAGAAAAALEYLSETQFTAAGYVKHAHPLRSSNYMYIDLPTALNLELIAGGGGREEGSPTLFRTLNRCRSAMGRRTLAEWLLRPLVDVGDIERRQDAVEWLVANREGRRSLRDLLGGCRDVERSSSRLGLGTGNPKDLGVIRDTLSLLPSLLSLCAGTPLHRWTGELADFTALGEELSAALADDLPRGKAQGGIIRDGYDAELDRWRRVESGASETMDEYVDRVRAMTGISRIKAGYNRVFGYYLEVSRAALASGDLQIPDWFIRKQTLVNAERFITEEMKELEERIASASSEIALREETLYDGLVAAALDRVGDLQSLGAALSALDVLASFAEVSAERGYTRPAMNEGNELAVKDARHPVVEECLGDLPFVPNSIALDGDGRRIALITGPNMAGKSTYLRTAALLVVMAQAGCFVPAEHASMGVRDRIFTRIGARDDLARGASTFMVEMVEMANILNHATSRSLLILDEIGRGTSTYDGISIAWSVVEYIHNHPRLGCKTLFATHYHELTELERFLPKVRNYNVAATGEGGKVVFTHHIVPGGADRSYGIHVGQMAGLPPAVIHRAEEILKDLEGAAQHTQVGRGTRVIRVKQLPLFGTHPVVEELLSLDVVSMSPLEALTKLFELQQKAQ